MVRDRIAVGGRSIGHGDAPCLGGLEIDALVAGAEARNDPQVREKIHVSGLQAQGARGDHGGYRRPVIRARKVGAQLREPTAKVHGLASRGDAAEGRVDQGRTNERAHGQLLVRDIEHA